MSLDREKLFIAFNLDREELLIDFVKQMQKDPYYGKGLPLQWSIRKRKNERWYDVLIHWGATANPYWGGVNSALGMPYRFTAVNRARALAKGVELQLKGLCVKRSK